MARNRPIPRILLVEDSPVREALMRSWMPPDLRVVVAVNAPRAIGLLRRDQGAVYAGILLDYDLHQRVSWLPVTDLNGGHVAEAVVAYVSREVPIFVHSANPAGAALMRDMLREAGFDVTQRPIHMLSAPLLRQWVEEAVEQWEG